MTQEDQSQITGHTGVRAGDKLSGAGGGYRVRVIQYQILPPTIGKISSEVMKATHTHDGMIIHPNILLTLISLGEITFKCNERITTQSTVGQWKGSHLLKVLKYLTSLALNQSNRFELVKIM